MVSDAGDAVRGSSRRCNGGGGGITYPMA